jgi:hypothetical protein
LNRKYNVVIRMGAPYFDAKVRHGDKIVEFDLRKMHKSDLRKFTVQLVRSFREAGVAA